MEHRVRQLVDDPSTAVEARANAVLLSAAPEMLSMLLKARYWAQMAATPDERRELADLIAKATSNSN